MPNYEARQLLDGRIGIFLNGLCVGVVHNWDELQSWFAKRRPEPWIPQDLNTAIRRMK